MRLLATGMRSFEQYCVRGIQANLLRIAELMSRSLMLVTALSSHIGYDRCALIMQSAYDQNITLKEAALASGFVTELQFDAWVLPKNLI
jgi:fumarate hydratase class II